MKKYFILLILVPYVGILSQSKSEFDINESRFLKAGLNKVQNNYQEYKLISEYMEATMVSGGYFTVGTNNGISDNRLDNNCSITFGHPYAMTSHPILSFDGIWQSYDDFLFDSSAIQRKIDTLTYTTIKNELKIEFSIIITDDKQGIKFVQTITNTDSISHSLGAGLIFDPSLGKFGDGYVSLTEGFLQTEKVFSKTEVPEQLTLWERTTMAKGLGIDLTFGSKPEKIITSNWKDLYNNFEPDIFINQGKKLYDTDIAIYWQSENLQPSESITNEATLTLLQPDFSSQVFTRWDLPSLISMEDNIIFPRNFDTYLELNSTTNISINDIIISIDNPSSLQPSLSEVNVSINSNNPLFQKMPLRSKIIYEDKIVDIGITIKKGSEVLDKLHRNVYIPATAVSDTGLIVNIDTVKYSDFPKVELIFETTNETNGFLITSLSSENIFLYENESRIEAFSMMKDTSGGVSEADIIFVLDVTGSMGNEIDNVKNNIIEFTDSLSLRGIDYRLGMVTFLDEIENIYPFTKDAQYFQNLVSQQYAHGGGDGPENSLEALMKATEFEFITNAARTVIWITDADYHENDNVTGLTKNEVINELLANEIIVHAIGNESYKSSFYDPIVISTGGNYYNIYGNFRDILLEISRFKTTGKYLISFQSPNQNQRTNRIKLEVHYNVLGGNAYVDYSPSGNPEKVAKLSFFPNPFNPQINFVVNRTNYVKGDLVIYNLLGERVKKFSLNQNGVNNISWNAKNEFGSAIGSGFYIVQLLLTDKSQKVHSETAKILYLK